jgi:hypothetical protein
VAATGIGIGTTTTGTGFVETGVERTGISSLMV